MSYFTNLNEINVNDHTENKGGLTYLSWAWAWRELKARYPKSYYTIYENEQGWNYHTDGRYCWVKTGVTVVDDELELEHIEYLPVMDYKNHSITADKVTSFDVNKTIQRSLTKAVARHGLGLYIYAGEDFPDEADGLAGDRKQVKASRIRKNAEEAAQGFDENEIITPAQARDIADLAVKAGKNIISMCDYFGVNSPEEMTKKMYAEAFRMLSKKAVK